VQQSSLRIHAGVAEVTNVLLNHLKLAYESKLDTVKLDDAVEEVGLGGGFASAREEPEEVVCAAPLAAALPGAVNDNDDDDDEVNESDDGGRKEAVVKAQLHEGELVPVLHAATASFTRAVLHVSSESLPFELSLNPLLPSSSASSVSIEFGPTLSTASLPHAAFGTFIIAPAPHGTCILTMAATFKCAGLNAAPPPTGAATATTELLPRANAELPLDRKHAHDLLDDLLSLLPAVSVHFDRSDEIDEKVHEELAHQFVTTSVKISRHEHELVDTSLNYDNDKVSAASEASTRAAAAQPTTIFSACDANSSSSRLLTHEKRWRRIPGTVKSPVSYFRALSTGESAWGKAEGGMDTSAARVLAYLWHFEGYERTKPRATDDLLHMALDVPDSHSMFQLAEQQIPLATNRVFACKWTWRREANDDFVVALTSIKDLPWSGEKAHVRGLVDKHKSADKVVHGELRGFYRIHSLAKNVCRVTFVGQSVLGGSIPDRMMNSLIKYSLGIVERVQDK
jgi:hypothetical protein